MGGPQEIGPQDKDVDQFTMAIEPESGGGALLAMKWEKTEYSVKLTVKK